MNHFLPQSQSIPLGPFQIFLKIRGDIRTLKVLKRENFSLAFFAQTKPIWVCDLENKIIKNFFGRLTP